MDFREWDCIFPAQGFYSWKHTGSSAELICVREDVPVLDEGQIRHVTSLLSPGYILALPAGADALGGDPALSRYWGHLSRHPLLSCLESNLGAHTVPGPRAGEARGPPLPPKDAARHLSWEELSGGCWGRV